MSVIPELPREVELIARTIGLLKEDGSLDADWFAEPQKRLTHILADATQRAALLELLETVLPHATLPGLPAGEVWYPLLGQNPRGNLHLIIRSNNGRVDVGFGGHLQPTSPATPPTALRFRLLLIRCEATGIAPIAGTSNGPLDVNLRVELNWQRGTEAIGLHAIQLTGSVAPIDGNPRANLRVMLEGLDLDGSGARDTVLDPTALGAQALDLILGLIQEKLRAVASTATPEAAVVAGNLSSLLGLDGAIPRLPFDRLTQGPAALQQWLNQLISQGLFAHWLSALGKLLGATVDAAGSGSMDDPWRIPINTLDGASSRVDLTFTRNETPGLDIGLRVSLIPNSPNPPARIEARAVLASFPLSGTTRAKVLPVAELIARAPGDDAAALVQTSAIAVKTLRAGLRWNGISLVPVLELLGVNLGKEYPRIDLTNVDSVEESLAGTLEAMLRAKLGNNAAGLRLAALAGLLEPEGVASWPHKLDAAKLVTDPASAIAQVHRAALIASSMAEPGGWDHLFNELCKLVGLGATVSGAGKRADPWRTTLAPGSLTIELAAWNEQTTSADTEPQLLRIGLRASATLGAMDFWWLAEILAFDLPKNGNGSVRLMAGQHAAFTLAPVPSAAAPNGIALTADAVGFTMDWAPGTAMILQAFVANLSVTVDGATTSIAQLKFPPPTGFDPTNPVAFGVPVASLETLFRQLTAQAMHAWLGPAGDGLASLLGVHAGLDAIPADWPLLRDHAGAGSLFTDPIGALRDWLARVVTEASADGQPHLRRALSLLRTVLANAVPEPPLQFRGNELPVRGAGTHADPWSLALTRDAAAPIEMLAWLEPDGPPQSWANGLANAVNGAADIGMLVAAADKVGDFVPAARSALTAISLNQITDALTQLEHYLHSSDGVVPLESQLPTGGTWSAGTAFECAHHKQPEHDSAITQILAQIDAWESGNRAVLLLGPAFATRERWKKLLSKAEAARSGSTSDAAHFDLRIPGVEPEAVDLDQVTEQRAFYTAHLQDNGTGDIASLSRQIGLLVARIAKLTSDAPLILVAHSTAGLAARAFAATESNRVRGLITLGTPHAGASLLPIRNADTAQAIRWMRAAELAVPAGPLSDALDHLLEAIDGYRKPLDPGDLPQPLAYPVGSFAGSATTDTDSVPALALGSTLGGSLLESLKQALATLATTAAAMPRATPTHIGFGLRASLGLPPSGSDLSAYADLRADVFRIALTSGAPAPARPAHTLALRIVLERFGGWLVGAPQAHTSIGAPPVNVRLRRAELGATITSAANGMAVAPYAQLIDGAFHGPLQPRVTLGDALAPPLLGALFQRLSNPAPAPGSGLDLLLDSLQALGLAVPDVNGGVGLSAEGLTAAQLDGAAFLAPRLRTAFDIPGAVGAFDGASGGPWTLQMAGLPLELYASVVPGTIGVRTLDREALRIGFGSATVDLRLGLPGFTTATTVSAIIGNAQLSYSTARGTLTFTAKPWLENFTLYPVPSPATFKEAFTTLIPRVMLSSAVSAFFQSLLGDEISIGPIDAFLASPSSSTTKSGALGDGAFLDAAKINQLLQAIGKAIGTPADTGLQLPGGLRLVASGVEPVTLRLETLADIGGVVGFQLDANIDRLFHVAAAGQLTLHVSLGGSSEAWPDVAVTFAVSANGVTLVVTPSGLAPIQLLPSFSGFGSIVSLAGALLPNALDKLVAALAPSSALDLTLDVAQAFDLYDTSGGFTAHSAQLRAMITGGWFASFTSSQQLQIANMLLDLFDHASSPFKGTLPGTFSRDANVVNWSFDVSAVPDAQLKLGVGWDSAGPLLHIRTTGFRPADAPVELDFAAGYEAGSVVAQIALSLRLQSSLGISVKPQLSAAFDSGGFRTRFLPLGSGTESKLSIDVTPAAGVTVGAGAVEELARQWLLPLVADALLSIPALNLPQQLWNGGVSLRDLLKGAGVIDAADKLLSPLPDVEQLITRTIATLVSPVELDITPTLKLKLANDDGLLGGRLTGSIAIPAGNITVKVLLGDPPSAIADVDRGITVYLLDTSSGSAVIDPQLHVVGLGLGLSGNAGVPLVNTALFRLGGLDAHAFFDVRFLNSTRTAVELSVTRFGAGAALERFGIPLGQALGQNAGGNNPVAASLLRSEPGDAKGPGDAQPVNPEIDLYASYRAGVLSVRFAGTTSIWIPVQRSFGPIYIDQIGVVLVGDTSVALLVDGSVKVAGLLVQADDLGVTIPFRSLLSPADWTLELRALAVSFQQGGVSIAGGLLKDPGPPVQYAGMLLVNFAGRGITAVGAYARPSQNGDSYTSFFAFASLAYPLGGPPYFFVLGLGGGIGYNRRLLIPEDTGQVGNFLLVSAIDNSSFANDPMGALRAMLTSVPPSRGSLWLAAGIKFTSFALIEGVAVLYVALDRGFEVGLLGLARMALPRPEFPIAMVELALKARFSSAEMLLSVQAQLTDNSFLFDRSCRLTGGFAFCIWFRTGDVVLTLGGYHPSFQKPAHFPVVPRLGFHWAVADNITIKGEAYFALTTTCVMAGGRLEASARFGPVRAWFTAYADFLVSWDPFYYLIDIGISVGIEARLRVCFIVCGTIHINVSVGAHLHLEGPPLHGTVTVEYRVVKITIPFGEQARKQDYISWSAFRDKYLVAGDVEGTALGIQLADGLVPPEPPGAKPAAGTASDAWKTRAEFVFTTETRMPADTLDPATTAVLPVALDALDLAPVGRRAVSSTHGFSIVRLRDNATIAIHADFWSVEPTISPFPEATWRMYEVGHVPAASRNIDALSGLTIRATAFVHGASEQIRITGMVDDDAARALPLPFATNDEARVGRLIELGTVADALVAAIPRTSVDKLLTGAEAVLTSPQFAEARAETRIDRLPPLSVAALRNRRSSPPLIEPLSRGLTMKPVRLEKPPEIVRTPPEPPVLLDRVRLRAVLIAAPRPVAAAPSAVALRTTVSHNSAGGARMNNIPRMSPPVLRELPGAHLRMVTPEGAPRPTVAAVGMRTLRNTELGFWQGSRQNEQFEEAAARVTTRGVMLPAGVMHVWDLPTGDDRTVTLSGKAAARVVFMDNAGLPLDDTECLVSDRLVFAVPRLAARVAILTLGDAPDALRGDAAFGLVSRHAAPGGEWPACGWQSGSQLYQLSSSLYLGRGAQVIASQPQQGSMKAQRSTQAMVLAADVVLDPVAIETKLPAGITVIAVLLDRADPSAADAGDLAIAAQGATLATPPIALGSGSRRMLLYDVKQDQQAMPHFTVTIASRRGWRVAGLGGLAGRAVEWANRFNGNVPENLVPDASLTATGSLLVRIESGEPQ